MYYLQSRYYDPTTCRFINADDINVLDNGMGSPIGKNLFAYCQNNPVGHSDSSGCWVLDAIFLAVDIAQFAMDPSWVGAGFILLDCLCFADPTGAADTGIHAAEIGVKAAEAAKDAEEVGHIAELSKSALKALRSKAVDKAWLEERELVKAGKGTREWTAAEKEELLNTGKVKGYEGHHINSVHNNQHLAGNPDNVKFMTRSEHFKEHGFNWRTSTDGALLNRQFMFK
jgi:RHS repeat-associated protein